MTSAVIQNTLVLGNICNYILSISNSQVSMLVCVCVSKRKGLKGWIKKLPFADSVPPVTHPATTVFAISCFARALKHKIQNHLLRKESKRTEAWLFTLDLQKYLLNNTFSCWKHQAHKCKCFGRTPAPPAHLLCCINKLLPTSHFLLHYRVVQCPKKHTHE